jgi:replicative DNA helicase
MLRRAQDALEGKTVPAVTTGLAKLDEVFGGLQAGDLAVYAGRPGMGKSAMLMTTALGAARQNRPVIVFSLEMSQERLLERMGCDIDFDTHHLDPLSYHWFRKGDLRPYQVERMAQAVRRMPDNLKIFDRGDLTIHEIAALARAEAQRSSRMGVVVIDYLQKVRATDRYAGNKVQEITEISGAAKALAMRIGWPVVVGAQLNRGVESREEKTPTLSDLRESGAIEQDADQVVGLYRPAYYIGKRRPAGGSMDPRWHAWQAEYEPVKNHLDLFVLKNRHGEENSVKVHCDMRASAIRDEEPRATR